jgi:toxin ParE1/3/4
MTRQLRWTKTAKKDLLDIWRWRGREYPERGDAILDAIETACARLQRFPYLGPALPRIAPDARKFSIENYLILYCVRDDELVIVRAVDQRRNLEAIAFDVD